MGGYKTRLFLLLVLVLLWGRIESGFAQHGEIKGVIKDATAAVIPGVEVTVKNIGTGYSRTTASESDGSYSFTLLPAGEYEVTAKLSGFKAVSRKVTVRVAESIRIDLTLEPGEISETVVVEAEAPLVQLTNANVGDVIDTRRIIEIPLNGRNFNDLSLLAAGTVVPPSNAFLGQFFGLTTSGAREDANDFRLDGVNFNDMIQNQINFQPNVDTIQEYKINNNFFDAQYGRSSGAVVNIITRSGTNEFHGTFFEFLRNDALDARNFFDLSREASERATGREIAPFKRNNFGFTLGGPIWKDQHFFFINYEGRRQRESETVRAIVPTSDERNGIFKDASGNVILDISGQMSPVSRKILSVLPAPNSPGVFNFAGTGSRPRGEDEFSVRTDHRMSQSDTWAITYIHQQDRRQEPTSIREQNIGPGFGDTRIARRQLASIRETHVFGPSSVNEFTYGFNRIRIGFFGNFNASPREFGFGPTVEQFPDINVVGAMRFGVSAAFPQGRADTTHTWSDIFSYTKGKHAIRAGVEFRRFGHNGFLRNVGGTFTFDGSFARARRLLPAGDPRAAIVDFLLGQAVTYFRAFGDRDNNTTTTAFNFFIQDDYKLTQRVTLNFGLRYEANTAPSEAAGKFTSFDLATRRLIGVDDPYDTDANNFGPRIGFAWDTTGRGKLVVRGGYGIFFDQPIINIVTPLATNPPFAFSQTFRRSVTLDNPTGLDDPRAPSTPSLSAVDPEFANAYTHQYNLNIQYELDRNTAFKIGYFGGKGTRLVIPVNINQAFFIPGSSTLANVDARRPFLGFGAITQAQSTANSNYNSMRLEFSRRASNTGALRGLSVNTNYTLNKSIDWNSRRGFAPIQDVRNLRAERGLSDFDARHRFVVSYIYDLPFSWNGGSSFVRKLVEGWSINGVTQFQSGNHFTIGISGDNTLTGQRFDRPNLVGNPALPVGQRAVERWFNTGAFVRPATGEFGNVGRNTVEGPGFNNFDFSIVKNTFAPSISESFKVQFRVEFFNLFNHPNFADPGRLLGTGAFGRVSGTRTIRGDAGSSRQVQFGLRVFF